MFERVYCVNLSWRDDRWASFTSHYPTCLPPVIRLNAIDRKRVKPPDWYKAGKGAWGCYRSHLRIIEECLNDVVGSVLILEDDVVFSHDFEDRAPAIVSELPPQWDMLYLGGNLLRKHIQAPVQVTSNLWRPYNVNSTFAYAVNGTYLQTVYHHLLSNDWDREGSLHHVDHNYGRLHENQSNCILISRPWLCGHGAYGSNIGSFGKQENWFRWWGATENLPERCPMAAVLGAFRGGTSCIAGILVRLGVNMGDKFKPPNKANPTGFYEAQQLAKICRQSFKEPWMKELLPKFERETRLREWADGRRKKASLIGGKHPTLCLMVPEILQAWGRDTKFIAVDRPIEKIQASLTRLKWGWCQRAIQNVPPMMLAARDAFLEDCRQENILRVDFDLMRANPEEWINRIVEFLQIVPSEEQKQLAKEFIRAES